MDEFREKAIELFAQAAEMDREQARGLAETPPPGVDADLAFPCFPLAKERRTAPPKIAVDIAGRIDPGEYFAGVSSAGPYVNFKVEPAKFAKLSLERMWEDKDRYGDEPVSRGDRRTVVIDFSSPNIAKPFGIGHLRSTVIGNALHKLYSRLGYEVVRINHLGDWGTQFGKLITAYKLWGDPEQLEREPIQHLLDLYVRFHKEAETNEPLDDEARDWFRKLEQGDGDATELWEQFREMSLAEFGRIYNRLGVAFDSFAGEAFYNDKIPDTLREIEAKGLAKPSEGATIVDLAEYDLPPCMLLKQDGSTLYATRDICAALYRKRTYDFDKMLYVVGSPQKLHFQQVFKVLELMGYEWAGDCTHVEFGHVRFADARMSTREGTVLLLEDVLAEAKSRARTAVEEKNPNLDNKDEVAEQVALGAVVFADLDSRRTKDVVFSWDEILSFEGETGPYLQYSNVRVKSVFRKSGLDTPAGVDCSVLINDEEQKLIKLLADFPRRMRQAADNFEPSILTEHLVTVASAFNKFYHEHRILVDESQVRDARLLLAWATGLVLDKGMDILGIPRPDRM